MGKPKESTKKSSRLLKRLEPYNKSPSLRLARREVEDRDSSRGHSSSASRGRNEPDDHGSRDRGGQRRDSSSRRDSRSNERSRERSISENRDEERDGDRRRNSRSRDGVGRSRSDSEVPPAWAQEILDNQRKNALDLQRLQSEFDAAKSKGNTTVAPGVSKVAEPEFRYQGNKKQFQLNSRFCKMTTNISVTKCLAASVIGLLPTQAMNTYMGSTLRSVEDVISEHSGNYVILVTQVAITIGLSVYVIRKARRELNKACRESEVEMILDQQDIVTSLPKYLDLPLQSDSNGISHIANGHIPNGHVAKPGHRRVQSASAIVAIRELHNNEEVLTA